MKPLIRISISSTRLIDPLPRVPLRVNQTASPPPRQPSTPARMPSQCPSSPSISLTQPWALQLPPMANPYTAPIVAMGTIERQRRRSGKLSWRTRTTRSTPTGHTGPGPPRPRSSSDPPLQQWPSHCPASACLRARGCCTSPAHTLAI
jgi:hypothetical protein